VADPDGELLASGGAGADVADRGPLASIHRSKGPLAVDIEERKRGEMDETRRWKNQGEKEKS
jgi:hypothetical protein